MGRHRRPALGLAPDPLRTTLAEPQHLVTLSSVEDDGLGEELQVIWEIEPGARAHEKVALPEPTGFDAPDRLDAFLDAVRWGAVAATGHTRAPGAVPQRHRHRGLPARSGGAGASRCRGSTC